MKTDKNTQLNELLDQAHQAIRPSDSWDALRNRIDHRMSHTPNLHKVAFWKYTAFGLAACLTLCMGLLVYQARNSDRQDHNLMTLSQQDQLIEAFTQVRDLFDGQCPWILVDAQGSGQIGIGSTGPHSANLVVLRLALSSEQHEAPVRYLDVVGLSGRDIQFSVQGVDDRTLQITLKPTTNEKGHVALAIEAHVADHAKASAQGTISDSLFTSLVRVPSHGDSIYIHAVGRSVSTL